MWTRPEGCAAFERGGQERLARNGGSKVPDTGWRAVTHDHWGSVAARHRLARIQVKRFALREASFPLRLIGTRAGGNPPAVAGKRGTESGWPTGRATARASYRGR
ncbi:hypothetical protein GCM10023170_082470 [Phytohabitans houttuyneae]|uniref:Uncharacterized protein n=1 Tax=Phytohabitans houttuyneae TaxID=1076126 RepID=A0A6V8KHL8_9ACTN|nr:hypothetical protein Phou_061510 [Phytohabitans houttuyneae]